MQKTYSHKNKLIAVVLTVSMLFSVLPMSLLASAYQLNTETVLADVNFDENNVVLKFGVLTDQHLSYQYHSHQQITDRIQVYANAVAAFDKLAGGSLNAVMSLGDYTSHGNMWQAETFAAATQQIMEAINVGKSDAEKTRFFMTYGNHDTCWNSNMPISESSTSDYTGNANYLNYNSTVEYNNSKYGIDNVSISGESNTWEELLNEYGLLADMGAVIDDEIAGDGTYLYSVTASNGDVYYFIALETDYYNGAQNFYKQSSLDWLDAKLAEITAANPDAYVYIGSHAPINKTGVYGANPELDQNAGWAATDKDILYNILKDYPQVVYMSGHTHYGMELETAIMSNTFTALTIPTPYSSDFWASGSGYDNDSGSLGMKSIGLGLYIEVDANGNQRIQRVIVPNEKTKLMNLTTVEYNYTNTSITTNNGGVFNQVITTDAVLNNASYTPALYGDAYLMPAPDATNTHLRYYSAERGENASIAFADNAAVTVTNAMYSNKNGLSATVTFDTATADKNILQYRMIFKTIGGAVLATNWAAGDWCDVTTGIVNGTSHLDATKLSYTMTGITTRNEDFYVEVVAVDEYGNMSEPIVSAPVTPDASGEAPVFNNAVHTNHFDNLQTTDAKKLNSAGATYFTLTEEYKNYVATWTNSTMESDAWNKTTFWTDPTGYTTWQNATKNTNNGNNAWDTNQKYAMYSTPFGAEDSFVYQATFNVSKLDGGHISFNFRSEEFNACSATTSDTNKRDGNDIDREGLRLTTSGVGLYLGNASADTVATSTDFKLSADNTDHTVTIYSTPTDVTVWIDDELIFYKVAFPGKEGLSTFYPSTTIWVGDIDVVMDNFKLWDPEDKAEVSAPAGAIEGPDKYADSLLIQPHSYDSEKMTLEYTKDSIYFNALEASQDTDSFVNINMFLNNDNSVVSPFAPTDTVTYEFTYTIDNVYAYNKYKCHDIMVYFRGNPSTAKNDTAYILLRPGTTLIHGPADYTSKVGPSNYITAGQTYNFKVVSDNTKCSIYINDDVIVEDWVYAENDMFADFNANSKAGFGLFIRDLEVTIDNFKISCNGQYGDDLAEVTKPTDENNLLNTHGNWTANYTGTVFGPQFDGNNAYINVYCKAQQLNNSSLYYTGFAIDPIESSYKFDKTKSYVMTAKIAKSNKATNPTEIGLTGGTYTSRITYYLGTYDGKELAFFIDDSGYLIFNLPSTGVTTSVFASDVVKAIELGEYFRMTAVISPYGIDVYLNGTHLTTISLPDPSKYEPDFFFRVNGTEAWFKDVAIWENTANGRVYYEGISSKYDYLATEHKGTRLEYTPEELETLENVKNALDAFDGTENTPLTPYVSALDGMEIPTVVNNYVASGATVLTPGAFPTALTQTGVNSFIWDDNVKDSAFWTTQFLTLFPSGSVPFEAGKKYVIEADVNISDVCLNPANGSAYSTRLVIRLGKHNTQNRYVDVQIQGSSTYVSDLNNSNTWTGITKGGDTAINLNTINVPLHVKFTVSDTAITYYLTSADGSKVYVNATANLADYGWTAADFTFNPAIGINGAKFTFTNLYVGEDITSYKADLDATLGEHASKDLSTYTAASSKNFTDVLEASTGISLKADNYSPAELTEAKTNVLNAVAALKVGTTLSIGDTNYNISVGETLPPVDERLDTKYILGWKDAEGNAYDGTTYVEGLVPDYVETKMLTVKFQLSADFTPESEKANIRYIASIDNLPERYNTVGWVFSNKNSNPEIGGANVAQRSSTTVYTSIIASGVERDATDIYGDVDYSEYLYTFQITNIPASEYDTVIYARPYVEMNDGRIVYGDIVGYSVNGLYDLKNK